MKVPTWATIVGVFMLLLGSCGAYNNVNKINMPGTLEQTSAIFDQMTVEFSRTSKEGVQRTQDGIEGEDLIDSISSAMGKDLEMDSASLNTIENVFGSLDEMMVFSDYYKKWIVRLGYLGLGVAIIYFLAGFFLVIGKPYSLKLTYVALGLSLAFMIFQIVIFSMDKEGGMVSRWSATFGSYFMIFINIVLLLIVATANKTFFYQHEIIQE